MKPGFFWVAYNQCEILSMKPRKVLFVDHAEAPGGAEQSLLMLIKFIDREKWTPILACPPGKVAQQAAGLEIDVEPIQLRRLRRSWRFPLDWIQGARQVAALARTLDASLIHANTVRAAVVVSPATGIARLPMIWHMRDFWLSENRPRWILPDRAGKKLLLRSSAAIIANSFAVASNLPESPKVNVVHNGVDTTNFDPLISGGSFRKKYQIPENAPLAGMVGRLRPWKGQQNFIRTAAKVHAALPDARFIIVGGSALNPQDDDYPDRLKRLATELGLGDLVILTGHLDDIRPALAALDVFVHPGDPEPFGLVNLEAMAMAKPIVAFGHGALPEIVVDLETGLLVVPGDTDSLAEATLRLLKDAALREQMGRLGRKRVIERFSIQKTVRRVEEVFEGTLSLEDTK
jgi:glycosyltransferase involved in cell wall biosynthesis